DPAQWSRQLVRRYFWQHSGDECDHPLSYRPWKHPVGAAFRAVVDPVVSPVVGTVIAAGAADAGTVSRGGGVSVVTGGVVGGGVAGRPRDVRAARLRRVTSSNVGRLASRVTGGRAHGRSPPGPPRCDRPSPVVIRRRHDPSLTKTCLSPRTRRL